MNMQQNRFLEGLVLRLRESFRAKNCIASGSDGRVTDEGGRVRVYQIAIAGRENSDAVDDCRQSSGQIICIEHANENTLASNR